MKSIPSDIHTEKWMTSEQELPDPSVDKAVGLSAKDRDNEDGAFADYKQTHTHIQSKHQCSETN